MGDSTYETVEVIDKMDYLNEDAFLVSWGVFLGTGVFTNFLVICGIIFLYTCSEDSRQFRSTPRLLPMLIGCLAHFSFLVGPSTVSLHRNRFPETRRGYNWTCSDQVALFVSYEFFTSFSILCVTVTVITEVMRVQRLVTLTRKVKMALTWILVALSFLYSLVVTVTVFYLVYLRDRHQPCRTIGRLTFIETSRKEGDVRSDYIVVFVLPLALTLLALLLLLLAFLTRCSASTGRGLTYAAGTPTDPDTAVSSVTSLSPLATSHHAGKDVPSPVSSQAVYVHTATSQGSGHKHGQGHAMATSVTPTAPSKSHVLPQEALGYSEDPPAIFVSRAPYAPSGQTDSWPAVNGGPQVSQTLEQGEEEEEEDGRVSRPLLVILAGLVAVVFNVLPYVYFEVNLEEIPVDEESWQRRLERNAKLWAAGTVLQFVGMALVSICWLLDPSVRPLIPKYFRNADLGRFRPSAP